MYFFPGLTVQRPYKTKQMPQSSGIVRSLVPIVLLALVAIGGCVTSPPVQEMSDARQAIAAAEQADAAEHAPAELNEAQSFLAQAEQQLREEAYGPARANAVRAKNRAVEALATAQASGSP